MAGGHATVGRDRRHSKQLGIGTRRPDLRQSLRPARGSLGIASAERGISNRVIAKRLGITQTNAGHHVERILAKLGMSSRTKVATWALDNMPPAASPLGRRVHVGP